MRGKLYTSYFAKIKKGRGIKVSVARYNPKWLKQSDIDMWLQDLAPDRSLLNDYKYKGISWEEYTQRYLNQIAFNEDSLQSFKKLKVILDQGNDVTIYCYEKPTDNCHRHLLGNLIKQNGYKAIEIN